MNSNKGNITVAILIGIASCVTNIFGKELHDWLSSSPSMNLSWMIPIFNLLLITGFVWWLLRIFTYKKLQEFGATNNQSKEVSELKLTVTK